MNYRFLSTTTGAAATAPAAGHHSCASCKHQRKRCGPKCILAPYFPSVRSRQFQAVHKVFGVSNVSKMIRAVGTHEERCRAAHSMAWEAEWRIKDPISGSYGEYLRLRREFDMLVAAWSTTHHNNIPAPAAIDAAVISGFPSQRYRHHHHHHHRIDMHDPPMFQNTNLKKGGGDTWHGGDM